MSRRVWFYYDYQDTNALIDEGEKLATEDAGRLKELAVNLKEETAALQSNIGKLNGINFKQIANDWNSHGSLTLMSTRD